KRTKRPAKHAVRYVEIGQAGMTPEGEQGRELRDGLEAPGGDADLSLVLVRHRKGWQLHGIGPGLVLHPEAFFRDVEGKYEIIQDDMVRERLVQAGAKGKKFARGADHRVKSRVLAFQERLIFPVQAFPFADLAGMRCGGKDLLFAGYAANARVEVVPGDPARGFPVEDRVG